MHDWNDKRMVIRETSKIKSNIPFTFKWTSICIFSYMIQIFNMEKCCSSIS